MRLLYFQILAVGLLVFFIFGSGHLIPAPQKADLASLAIYLYVISLILFSKVVKLKRFGNEKMNELRDASEKIARLQQELAANADSKQCGADIE